MGQLIDIGLSGCQQGSDGRAAFVSQNVAVGSGEFLYETVSSEQSELSGHEARAAFVLLSVGLGREKQGAQVSVAKSVDFKFTSVDGLQQAAVLR